MSDRDRERELVPDPDTGLSTDVGEHPEVGTRIGAVPGHGADVDISGYPGGGTGAGAWPDDMGTSDDAPSSAERRRTDAESEEDEEQIGARHGQIADSGVNTGPVPTERPRER